MTRQDLQVPKKKLTVFPHMHFQMVSPFFFFFKHKSLSVYISVQKASLFSDVFTQPFYYQKGFLPFSSSSSSEHTFL